MIVILFLIPLSIALGGLFLFGFFWAVRSGQYEDTCTPSMRPLLDEPAAKPREQIRVSQMNPSKSTHDEIRHL